MARLKTPTSIGGHNIRPEGPSVNDVLAWSGEAYIPVAPDGFEIGGGIALVSGTWTWESDAPPPEAGQIRPDTSELHLHNLDSGTRDWAFELGLVEVGGQIVVRATTGVNVYTIDAITDHMTYQEYGVTLESSTGSIADSDVVSILILPAGIGGGGGGDFVPIAGGTMTGLLVLSADPAASLGAATKQYVDTRIPPAGYLFGGTVKFTASGSFVKATYPGLRAVLVKCQGSGGAGGGVAVTAAGTTAFAAGGGAGGYASTFVLVADLAASEAVTVGAGGTGVSAANGNGGNDSVFDTISGEVRGAGGGGGPGMAAGTSNAHVLGGGIGTGTGDIVIAGSPGMPAVRFSGANSDGTLANGGASHLGGGGRGRLATDGDDAAGSGGGGGGAGNGVSQAARAGGNGGAGIVLVDLYY